MADQRIALVRRLLFHQMRHMVCTIFARVLTSDGGVRIALGCFNDVGDDAHQGFASPIARRVADCLGRKAHFIGALAVAVKGLQHFPPLDAGMVFAEGGLGAFPVRETDVAGAAAGLDDPLQVLGAIDVLEQDALISLSQRYVLRPMRFSGTTRANVETGLEGRHQVALGEGGGGRLAQGQRGQGKGAARLPYAVAPLVVVSRFRKTICPTLAHSEELIDTTSHPSASFSFKLVRMSATLVLWVVGKDRMSYSKVSIWVDIAVSDERMRVFWGAGEVEIEKMCLLPYF